MLDLLFANASVFLIVAVRCFAFLMTMPLFSLRSVNTIVRVALTGYMAFFILPNVNFNVYSLFSNFNTTINMYYILVLIGEAFIGIILGFFVSMIFAAFSSAGQFFAFQMGFSATAVYDSLSQVENPLMGQFFNLISMLIFLQTGAFQVLFFDGLKESFSSLSAYSLILNNESLVKILVQGLSKLFVNAFVISLPILGSLCLVSISMGVLTKAAPQMNLLSESFPIMILFTFLLLVLIMPSLIDFFVRSFYSGFNMLENLFLSLGGKQI